MLRPVLGDPSPAGCGTRSSRSSANLSDIKAVFLAGRECGVAWEVCTALEMNATFAHVPLARGQWSPGWTEPVGPGQEARPRGQKQLLSLVCGCVLHIPRDFYSCSSRWIRWDLALTRCPPLSFPVPSAHYHVITTRWEFHAGASGEPWAARSAPRTFTAPRILTLNPLWSHSQPLLSTLRLWLKQYQPHPSGFAT